MPAHERVRAWIAQNYQRPAVDQEWLADCSDWLSSELNLDPDKDFPQFIQHVEAQLLQSNLADSTVPGTGIDPLLVPPHPPRTRPAPRRRKTTGPTPLLVEIKSITEIAHSAFNLLNIHQTRLDRADLGLAQGDANAEQHHGEDDGPVPRFPRGMLRLELSDGVTTFRAIEFRSLPQLELGTTPLGYKMILKLTPIRNGIAYLEPANVTLKGYRTEDHDIYSEQVFLSSLRKRLGRPDPPLQAPAAALPRPPPAQPARPQQPPPVAQPRPPSPPVDLDDMYVDDDIDPDVLREMAIQMDQAVEMEEKQRPRIRPVMSARPPSTSNEKHIPSSNPQHTLCLNATLSSSSIKPASTVKTSPYFDARATNSRPVPDIGLSPLLAPPFNRELDFDIVWDADDPKPSEVSIKKSGSTSAGPPSTSAAKPVVQTDKRPSSPDLYDDLSLDMDVDESFFQQIGMIEQGALRGGANNKGKGKDKDTGTEGTTSQSCRSAAPGRKAPSNVALGTKRLAISGAEPSTRVQSSTKRTTSGSTETLLPPFTESSGRRPRRDSSLIVISSSEDEGPGGGQNYGSARPLSLARRRAHTGRERIEDKVADADADVIDISD